MKDIREEFPILKEKIDGYPLVYFDNAATTQKPKYVLNALMEFYTKYNSNIHRGIYSFGEKATILFEDSRKKIASFIGANPQEVIFTKGTTEGINFIASTWADLHIGHGDEIVLSEMEHHANLIPWQQVAKKKGAKLKFITLGKDYKLDLDNLSDIITKKTKLVSIVHVSNVLGTHNDVLKIGEAAKSVGAKFFIDAAQSVPHQKIDVKKLGCDFLAFSGHKMMGPTGVGVLYIKKDVQDEVPPYQFGGGMVFEVDFQKTSWSHSSRKYEAGTPAIAQVIGLGAAVDYFNSNIDFKEVVEHEASLCSMAIDGLSSIGGVRIVGPIDQLKKKGHLVTFTVDSIHSHDVAAYLSSFGICTRAGHNCAQPLAKKIGIDAAVRASFYFYNTEAEVDFFLQKMREIRKHF